MSIKLIVNADDFGIHPAVNEAVYQGFTQGILTSTSIMAGGGAFEEACQMAKSMEGLGIGVHLTLVGGIKSVLDAKSVPSLTWEDGVFCQNYLQLIQKDLKGQINTEEVYNEWDAQIKKIMDAGLKVTHLDGHQHMHMWSRFFPIALALAQKYRISCMRVPDESYLHGFSIKNSFRYFSKNGLSLMARSHRPMLKRFAIASNDYFWGMTEGGHLNEKNLNHIIDSLHDGINEIMCHPSANEKEMENIFHWGYHGEDELASICSLMMKEKIEKKEIQFISYEALARK